MSHYYLLFQQRHSTACMAVDDIQASIALYSGMHLASRSHDETPNSVETETSNAALAELS
jgi:hypothetical protein